MCKYIATYAYRYVCIKVRTYTYIYFCLNYKFNNKIAIEVVTAGERGLSLSYWWTRVEHAAITPACLY